MKKKCDPVVTYTVIKDITEEILPLAEVKKFLQLDFCDFDEIITIIIKAAREEAEKYTGLSIGTREIQLAGDWEDEDAYMPFMPIINTSESGLQVVGYTNETFPGDLKLGILNMIYIAFNNRAQGLDFTGSLKLLAKSRRRVGL